VTTDPTRTETVSGLAHELIRHTRMLNVVKAGVQAGAPHNLEGAEIPLLMHLVKQGPRRQGELAEIALLDASTVSRYVGQLARRGLVERRPDPADGRAVQLVATERGHETARAMVERRNEILRQVLAQWSDDEVRTLTALLTRLNDDIEAARADLTGTTSTEEN
jgi:DNA-binding MarR family transcriptional regulator